MTGSDVNIQHYLRYRLYYETVLWMLFITWHILANVYVAIDDNLHSSNERWEPVLWETSSTIMFAFLIPLMLMFDRRYPIQFATLKTHLPIHVLATIPFCLLHVVGMVILRELGYGYMHTEYDFGHWPTELIYEYAKDFRTYFYLLIIIYLYRLILFRTQGEATVPDTTQAIDSQEPVLQNRFSVASQKTLSAKQHLLVKKLGKEFLVRIEDIDWLEACGNYVNLHVSGRVYPYRGTMNSLEEQLDPQQFLRVHRSYMVNYQQINSIEPLESGDARIHLRKGNELPLSRRYRAAIKTGQQLT